MANLPMARTVSASSDGQQKMRATTSLPSPTYGTTVFTSSADSQLMMAPSPSRPASFNMPGRSAATSTGGAGTPSGNGRPSLKPLTLNVSYSSVTFSPESAALRNRTVSRVRLNGSSNGMPFHRSTMTFDDVPTPMATRPGAASHSAAALWASSAGPRR